MQYYRCLMVLYNSTNQDSGDENMSEKMYEYTEISENIWQIAEDEGVCWLFNIRGESSGCE